jgi:uncharacterized DUF497 family protein
VAVIVSSKSTVSAIYDRSALTVYDTQSSQNEERWFTLGFDANGQLLAVAHKYESTGENRFRVRIISAVKPRNGSGALMKKDRDR